MSSGAKIADVAFKVTTMSLFATTIVSGAWFVATAANGFVHYGKASSEAKEKEKERTTK